MLQHGNFARKTCQNGPKGQNLPKPGPRTDLETTGARNDRQISRNISTVSISTSTGNFRKKMGESLGDPPKKAARPIGSIKKAPQARGYPWAAAWELVRCRARKCSNLAYGVHAGAVCLVFSCKWRSAIKYLHKPLPTPNSPYSLG